MKVVVSEDGVGAELLCLEHRFAPGPIVRGAAGPQLDADAAGLGHGDLLPGTMGCVRAGGCVPPSSSTRRGPTSIGSSIPVACCAPNQLPYPTPRKTTHPSAPRH